MIDVIFTIDYEIYGNGEGSLKDHVFDPVRRLQKIFNQVGEKLVFFVEAAEFEKIEAAKSNPAITDVKKQIKELYSEGHEIALHLHPQWYNGNYKNGRWDLDNAEYNLCILSEQRITSIVDRSINYLRYVLSDPDFTPLSFRAGNWLFQPTQPIAEILAKCGIKIDSSVFKGGLQHQHQLDYRPALLNGFFWKFHDDVNKPVSSGELVEIPIYSEMVPPWRMATKKRLEIQQKSATGRKTFKDKINRVLDLARPLQPLKLDFCRMNINELTSMMNLIIKTDQKTSDKYKPIAVIGHTKDLVDFDTVDKFLSYLHSKEIRTGTFKEAYNKIVTS